MNGSDSIIESKIKKLNNKYFNWLITNSANSTNNNMKAVAYMLDTNIWSMFANSTERYAEYAIGGPTVELLFTAYNRYKGLMEDSIYTTQVISKKGYQISKNGGTNYADYYSANMIENDTNIIDNPYSVSNFTNPTQYWIASPSNLDTANMFVVRNGGGVDAYLYKSENTGFRPLVLLNSNYVLEKTKDSNGNDAFKIVEQ